MSDWLTAEEALSRLRVRPQTLYAYVSRGRLRAAVEAETGEKANVDFGLAALRGALDLPEEAPFALFATARTAGWLAHAIEQVETGRLIRPRARYVGVPPDAAVASAPSAVA